MAFQPNPRAPQPSEGSSDESAVESSTFHMYFMKVTSCPNGRQPHDWNSCPYTHCGEKAVRRDPLTHQYSSIMCHDAKQDGKCAAGDSCPFSHNTWESWLHPEKYRTSLCRNGPFCQRKICFFAHSAAQLRAPASERLAIPPLVSPPSSSVPAASPMLPPNLLGPSSPQQEQRPQQRPACPLVMVGQAGRLDSGSSSGSGRGSREGLLSSGSGGSMSSVGLQLGHSGLLADIPMHDAQLGSPMAVGLSPAVSLASSSSGSFTSAVPSALLLQSLAPGAEAPARPPVALAPQGVGLSQAVSILQVVAGQVQGGHLDVSTAAVLLSTLIPGQLPLLQLAMAAEV